ncbi:MAG TPA: hypothetical protein VGY48_29570 [Vicinamibacterales bacterium]|jgi:hypothetical protein|nr:hypothetical protein [Vicinamibacterales bacterium]
MARFCHSIRTLVLNSGTISFSEVLTYTADVRRLLVCVLGFWIVVMSAIDPTCCVDGCGRTGLAASHTAAAAASSATDCPFCSGLLTPEVAPFAAEIALLESVPDVRIPVPVLLLICAIERPPRA